MTQEAPKKNWKERRGRPHLRTSASQYETFELCHRKWWLAKVRGLDEGGSTGSQVFGTVLHAVADRYCSADDLGRDPATGRAVNLYPEGWHVARSRFGGIDGEIGPADQALVKALVAAGIESGVLVRLPGREVEQAFEHPVVEVDGVQVKVVGFIDLYHPGEIHDHKTAKSTRYLKTARPTSPNYLGNNLQMMIYAKVALDRARAEGHDPREMVLRHNAFIKDPARPQVRKTEVTVSAARIDAFWQKVVDKSRRMVRLRASAQSWKDLPDPVSGPRACNAYGGCPFRPICSGQETEEQYEARLAKSKAGQYTNPVTPDRLLQPTLKGTSMTSFAEALARKKALTAAAQAKQGQAAAAPAASVNPAPIAAAAPAPAAAPAAAPAPATTAAAAPAGDAPPWTNPSCPVCKATPGFNKSGSPCRMCQLQAPKHGRPSPEEFFLEPNADGTVTWVHKENPELSGISPMGGGVPPVEATERVQAPEAPAAEPAPQPAPQPAPAPAAQPAAALPPAQPASQVVEAEPEAQPEPSGPVEVSEVIPAGEAAPRPHDNPVPVVELPTKAEVAKAKDKSRRKGFILCINCYPVSGSARVGSGRFVHDLADVFGRYCQALATECGVESFYDLKAFDRRDMIAKAADKLADEFKNDIVAVTGLGAGMSDMRALVDALKPVAGMVIEGTNG